MKLPMREKYVDEAVGLFIIFGIHADGSVDVSNGRTDVFVGIPREQAEQVVAAHDRFRKELYRILCETKEQQLDRLAMTGE